MVHAFPLDHTQWDPQAAFLGDRHRLLAPDLPGFGQSPPRQGWRIADVAAGILDIALGEGHEAFGVLGLSMGTYTALELWRQAPERIRCLVLANGRARADSVQERQARGDLIARIEEEGAGILPEMMLSRLLKPQPDPKLAERLSRDIARTPARSITAALEALRERADSTALLSDIRCPTLVIAGEFDPITSTAECRAMASEIPGARFVEIPDAGHLSNLENPTAFNRAIGEFLDSLPG